MIFVTVGTHEQQFDRLIKSMDEWASKHDEEVIIQTGYSTYHPKYAKWKMLFSYSDMIAHVNDARIVITHGGPSSFIMPLQIGKTPIVFPRKQVYDEHVNNHQLEFSRQVEKMMGTIIVAEEVDDLYNALDNYEDLTENLGNNLTSNNSNFCDKLGKIIEELVK